MKPKVLKTDRDHKAAFAHVEALMDGPVSDETELELWSLLVEKYEEEHFPIAAPDPIEAIRFRMEGPSQRVWPWGLGSLNPATWPGYEC